MRDVCSACARVGVRSQDTGVFAVCTPHACWVLSAPSFSSFVQVYALWLVPEMLPTFVIHSPVSSFILKGADLMMPGVVLPLTIRSQEKFKKEEGSGVEDLSIALQELWSIRVVGNR